MTKNEIFFIVTFLNELSDRFGCDGCNDMKLKDTPGNRELVIAAERHAVGEEGELDICDYKDGRIIVTNNTFIVDYLKDKLSKENNITKSDLPDGM